MTKHFSTNRPVISQTFASRLAKKLPVLVAIIAATQGSAFASSFQILEQSPAHLGHAFAGTASNIADASTVFFNPAGMTQFNTPSVTTAGNLIFTRSQFHDQGSNTHGTGGKTEETGFVPNLYYVQPLAGQLSFGFGVNAPFGLASDYGTEWMGRYLATYSELRIVAVNSTLAYEVNPRLSLGLGISYQHAKVTLESQVDSTLGVNPDPSSDSRARIEGSDYAFVADASLLFRPTAATNLGLVWRQGADFSLDGDASFSLDASCSTGAGFPTGAPPAPTTGSLCAAALATLAGDVQAGVELPDTLTFSLSHQVGQHWRLHGDIAWTEWSAIQAIEVINTGNQVVVDNLELYYEDTLRYALGVTYDTNTRWTWRAGIAVDEAPQTHPQLVNPRIPDQDRTWLGIGFNYAISEQMSIDLGYARIRVEKATIDAEDLATGHRVQGEFDADVDIIGVQANWNF